MPRKAVSIAALGLATALGACRSAGPLGCPAACAVPYVSAIPAAYAPLPAPWDPPFADYTHRILTVSSTAGNAQAANTALQTASPWPPYSHNTNIPANGARMANAVQNFERGIVVPPPPGFPPSEGGGGTAAAPASGAAGGGSAAAASGAAGGGGTTTTTAAQ